VTPFPQTPLISVRARHFPVGANLLVLNHVLYEVMKSTLEIAAYESTVDESLHALVWSDGL
jgi:hypothetical protein